jgi:phosphoribosylformylglycinamidine cyclo-ligase
MLPELGITIADELLKLHKSYLPPIRALHKAGILQGAAHITGGGITDNLPRILPKGLGARVDPSSWPSLPIFDLLRKIGNIPEEDFRRTFNIGIGMILVVRPDDRAKAARLLKKLGEAHYIIGEVIDAPRKGGRVAYQ